ncbi:MAG: calcium/sodium antiporter [Candidatus Paceibacterota bacterium]
MELSFWILIFVVSFIVLLRGSSLLIRGAEKIGLAFGLPPFVIGVLIVGVGTSLPELASAVAAVAKGVTEVVTANAIGSNITNILLVGGILAVVGKRIEITKSLRSSELPLFVVSTALFLGVVFDGEVSFIEAILLVAAFVIYLLYSLAGKGGVSTVGKELGEEAKKETKKGKAIPSPKAVGIFTLGLAGVFLGAKFLVDSLLEIASIFEISPALISLTALALGTSFPELFVSLRALFDKRPELAIGNIFGSNAFNILLAVGVPAMVTPLFLDSMTLFIGVPILAVASFIFLISGIAGRLNRWEGFMFLVLYVFFVLKLLGF